MTRSEWQQFCKRAATLMRNALDKKEGGGVLYRGRAFGQVVDYLHNDMSIGDPRLRDDIFNLLMEVGGAGPKYYLELLNLFDAGASQEELRQYFDT